MAQQQSIEVDEPTAAPGPVRMGDISFCTRVHWQSGPTMALGVGVVCGTLGGVPRKFKQEANAWRQLGPSVRG